MMRFSKVRCVSRCGLGEFWAELCLDLAWFVISVNFAPVSLAQVVKNSTKILSPLAQLRIPLSDNYFEWNTPNLLTRKTYLENTREKEQMAEIPKYESTYI